MSDVTCDEVLRELQVYLDGELPADQARDIERHLSDCSPCLDRQSFQSRLRTLVRERCGRVEALPEGLADRIRRAISSGLGSSSAD